MAIIIKKKNIRIIIFLSVFAVCAAVLTIIFLPFIQNLKNEEYRESVSSWVKSHGINGVAVLFGIQILQIFIAVIPGGPIQIIAGMAYGALGGFAIIITGCIISSVFIFFIGKKFGLPLLRRFIGEDDINTWKFLKDSRKTARIVFILFLIPGTPKDMLTWLAPLTNISLPVFVTLSVLARIPAILTSTITGDSMIQENWILSISLFAGIAVAGFLGMWLKDKIIAKSIVPAGSQAPL
ncbi:MAG: VTT domain-containing protein [Treponema sp.]|nr:VTT domain-containing protein [Treponema sp.]